MRRSPSIELEAGLSLTELLVVSAILVVMTGLIYATFRYESRAFARESGRAATQADLRIWMVRMVKDIRNARYDPRGSAGAAISSATATDLEFTTDLDKSGAISGANENLGYRLNGTTLQLWQGGTSWRTVVTGVQSLGFSYWDYQGNQVNATSPYTTYQDISEVRIAITAQSSDGPTTITESGRALIRNPNPL